MLIRKSSLLLVPPFDEFPPCPYKADMEHRVHWRMALIFPKTFCISPLDPFFVNPILDYKFSSWIFFCFLLPPTISLPNKQYRIPPFLPFPFCTWLFSNYRPQGFLPPPPQLPLSPSPFPIISGFESLCVLPVLLSSGLAAVPSSKRPLTGAFFKTSFLHMSFLPPQLSTCLPAGSLSKCWSGWT